MSDVHSKEIRSYNMSRIKDKNTKPEMIVRKFLHSNGFRYNIHSKQLPGKPDIVLPRFRTAVFINGCFWHGHEGCKYFKIPETETEWWKNKIYETRLRDKTKYDEIEKMNWKVITIWECELKNGKKDKTLADLLLIFRKDNE